MQERRTSKLIELHPFAYFNICKPHIIAMKEFKISWLWVAYYNNKNSIINQQLNDRINMKTKISKFHKWFAWNFDAVLFFQTPESKFCTSLHIRTTQFLF
jgi:hypothetical protein